MRDSDSTITNEVIALFYDLVAIDSPSGHEGKMADKTPSIMVFQQRRKAISDTIIFG